MPHLATNTNCTGCAACFNACSKDAILMIPDKTGFLYPVVDNSKCIDCGVCTRVCPSITPLECGLSISPKAYIAQNLNEKVRAESTSGGAFTAIAESVIQKGGVVFGAMMDDDNVVRHHCVTKEEDLWKFRNSKYVQSEIGNSYRLVKEYINQERVVCFSGTPCQIQGLIAFLKGKKREFLVTVDIVCHCVPSPLIFKKYLDFQQKQLGSFNRIVFRDKKFGYSYSTMALYRESSCVYRKGSESDLWFRAFLHGFCDRDSCGNCFSQAWPRMSDITIWDCFNVAKINPDFDDNKGTTSIITWSGMGDSFISNNTSLRLFPVNPLIFKKKIEREHFSDMIKVDKETMYNDAQQMGSIEFFHKYLPTSTRIRLKGRIRYLLYKVGLYDYVKKIVSR